MSEKRRYVYVDGPVSGATLDDGTQISLHPGKEVRDATTGKPVDVDPSQAYIKRLLRKGFLKPVEKVRARLEEKRAARAKRLAERKDKRVRPRRKTERNSDAGRALLAKAEDNSPAASGGAGNTGGNEPAGNEPAGTRKRNGK